MVVKGLYITCREWDEALSRPPFLITEDVRYVMGSGYKKSLYRPIPFEDFDRCVQLLPATTALSYNNMCESIDRDKMGNNSSLKHFLLCNTLVRVRRDSLKSLGAVHTLMIVGAYGSVIQAAENIELPHPFDRALYPYSKIFKDVSGASEPVDVLKSFD